MINLILKILGNISPSLDISRNWVWQTSYHSASLVLERSVEEYHIWRSGGVFSATGLHHFVRIMDWFSAHRVAVTWGCLQSVLLYYTLGVSSLANCVTVMQHHAKQLPNAWAETFKLGLSGWTILFPHAVGPKVCFRYVRDDDIASVGPTCNEAVSLLACLLSGWFPSALRDGRSHSTESVVSRNRG
jgi:hypothetical protein